MEATKGQSSIDRKERCCPHQLAYMHTFLFLFIFFGISSCVQSASSHVSRRKINRYSMGTSSVSIPKYMQVCIRTFSSRKMSSYSLPLLLKKKGEKDWASTVLLNPFCSHHAPPPFSLSSSHLLHPIPLYFPFACIELATKCRPTSK